MVGNGQITHNFFGFRKNLYKIGFLGIYRKCDPRQFLLTVNNCDSIQKSCLLQQLIGLPSCKTRTVYFIMWFWYRYFRNYCIKLAITDKTCFQVVCSMLPACGSYNIMVKYVSNVKKNSAGKNGSHSWIYR